MKFREGFSSESGSPSLSANCFVESSAPPEPPLNIEVDLSDRRFFAPFAIRTDVDRYGAVGYVEFGVDWRPKSFKTRFLFTPLDGDTRFSSDDMKRALDEVLNDGPRSPTSYALKETVYQGRRDARERFLQAELDRFRKELWDILQPCRILCDERVNTDYNQYRDEEGRVQDDTRRTRVMEWIEYVTSPQAMTDARRRVRLLTGDVSTNREQNEHLREGLKRQGDLEATRYFREQVSRLREVEARSDIRDLIGRYRRIEQELEIFGNGCELTVNVMVVPGSQGRANISALRAAYHELSSSNRIRYLERTSRRDSLEDLGMAGTRRWYQLQGIDINEDPIPFPLGKPQYGSVDCVKKLEEKKLEADRAAERERREALLLAQQKLGLFEQQSAAEALLQEKARVEAELTPEIVADIEQVFDQVQAVLMVARAVLRVSPAERELTTKLQAREQKLEKLRAELRERSRGIELKKDADKILQEVHVLASQKAINQARPNFQAILERAPDYQAVPGLVKASTDCAVVLEGESISEADLVAKIRRRLVESPERIPVSRIIVEVCDELMGIEASK